MDSILAVVAATTESQGGLTAVYSRFRMTDDFSRLKLDLELKSDLVVSGDLTFKPGNIPVSLQACIETWNGPFASRTVPESSATSILTSIETGEKELTANWSGFVMPFTMTPSPLESVFVTNPQLLASCGIG